MGPLLIGLYLIVVGLRGNAGGLITALQSQKGFLPWVVAVWILWAIWTYTPAPAQKTARALIIVGIIGIVLMKATAITSGTKTAWTNLKTFFG